LGGAGERHRDGHDHHVRDVAGVAVEFYRADDGRWVAVPLVNVGSEAASVFPSAVRAELDRLDREGLEWRFPEFLVRVPVEGQDQERLAAP
jgi:hypothetical protein